jgi:hypothetical protein
MVLIFFIVASRKMSLTGNNGLSGLLFLADRRACWRLVLEIHGPWFTPPLMTDLITVETMPYSTKQLFSCSEGIKVLPR